MSDVTVLPLVSLMLSALAVATSELMMMRLLPELANSLNVSIPQAGLLVSGYAVSCALPAAGNRGRASLRIG